MKNIKIKDTEFNFINTIIGLFSGFVNGLFGSGGGILLIPILNNIGKTEEHKSHAYYNKFYFLCFLWNIRY